MVRETHPRAPAELFAGLGRVAEERLDLGRPEVARVDPHHFLARRGEPAAARDRIDDGDLLGAGAAPGQRDAQLARGRHHEIAHAVLLAGRDDEVIGLLLLQYQPFRLDVVAGMAPVALRVEVPEVKAILHPEPDAGEGARDLARDERLAADRRLVVEEYPVAGVDPVRLAV